MNAVHVHLDLSVTLRLAAEGILGSVHLKMEVKSVMRMQDVLEDQV